MRFEDHPAYAEWLAHGVDGQRTSHSGRRAELKRQALIAAASRPGAPIVNLKDD